MLLQQPIPPERGSRGRAGMWVIVGLVVAAIALGGFAVWKVFFAATGGADSPTEAVDEVIAAAESQDPLAALQMINPGESRGADEVWEALQQRLDDAGVITADGVFEAAGVSFNDVEYEVEEFGDHAAKVTLTSGTVTVNLRADQFPGALDGLEHEARNQLGEEWRETYDLAEISAEMMAYDWESQRETQMGVFVMAVEEDGRWYVSPTATAAEYLSYEIFGRGGDWSAYDGSADRERVGASTPEDAIEALAEVATSDDLPRLLDALPPGQGDLLRPFVSLVESELARYDAGFTISLRSQDVRAGDEDDGLVRVDIDAIELDVIGIEGGDRYPNEVGLDGSCGWANDYDGYGGDGCAPTWLKQVSGIDNAFVMVRQTDGVWQVDPFATALAWLEALAENVPDAELDSLVEAIDGGYADAWLSERLG